MPDPRWSDQAALVRFGLAAVVACAALTAAAAWLGWWAVGGGYYGLFPALLLSGGVAGTLYLVLRGVFITTNAGSIRQGKKALHEAERDGHPIQVVRARARLSVARWQRRQ
jgi:uncharacterized membrane protein